jgi:hypothetical protein
MGYDIRKNLGLEISSGTEGRYSGLKCHTLARVGQTELRALSGRIPNEVADRLMEKSRRDVA